MPASWTARGPVMNANGIGQSAFPLMQPTYTPMPQTPRGTTIAEQQGLLLPRYATSQKPGRPYSEIGKMSVDLANPGALGRSAQQAAGGIEGLFSGGGRLFGQVASAVTGNKDFEKGGADIGAAIGHVAQMPVDFAAGVLGHIPALPGANMPAMLGALTNEGRQKIMAEAGDNPFALQRLLSGLTAEDWQSKIASGEVNPIFGMGAGPEKSLGDQLMHFLGAVQIPGTLLERAWAGGPGEAINRVMTAPIDDLTPEVQQLRQQYKDGTLSHDQMLDRLSTSSAGYSNNWIVNTLGEMVFDPANLLFGAGVALGGVTKTAKVMQAAKFAEKEVGLLSAAKRVGLAEDFARDALAKGTSVAVDQVTPSQLLEYAQQTGKYTEQVNAARRSLSPYQQMSLTPAWSSMQRVADVSQKILDPTTPILGAVVSVGKRGARPLANAYLTRESTKGVARAYGIANYGAVSQRLAAVGKSELFDNGMGYFGAQEGLLMAGDSLASDVLHTRQIMDARPTKIALARAGAATANYATNMERWVGRRMADLARLTGGTAEEAMARAERFANDRLVRMGLTAEEAASVTKGLDHKGLSMIDAMYYGHRIEKFNVTVARARDAMASHVANLPAGESLSKVLAGRQNLLDRITLIGPRELTAERAAAIRASIKDFEDGVISDATVVRDAARQYDRLAYEVNADQLTDAEITAHVKSWLDEFDGSLTHEADAEIVRSIPELDVEGGQIGDGYVYGLRPEDGAAEWRAVIDPETGVIKHANPWIDIVGDKAQPWNRRFDGDGRISSMASAVERSMQFMGQQITSDRIDREARRGFVQRAMGGWTGPVEGRVGSGLTYHESVDLFNAVKKRALDASTTPRGMDIKEFEQIIADTKAGTAASRVGMSARDLQLTTLQSFEGQIGTVGLSQKFTGKLKTKGQVLPLLPENSLGVMAERMYPLVRFSLNPVFQAQEWVEPWVFAWAHGKTARMTGGWTDPITGAKVTLDDQDLIQQHLIERYATSNPEAQFDMMERSLTYLFGAKSAKEAAAKTDQNAIRAALGRLGSTHSRKAAAQSEMFRHNLGPMLKDQFDAINPNIWLDLEREFGTKDAGTIAVRWLSEKDVWANADPRVAFHLMDAAKQPRTGALAQVSTVHNAEVVFKTTPEALNTQIARGELTQDAFEETMLSAGADPSYIGRSWKVAQFEVNTGGVDKFWDDGAAISAGGVKEAAAVRSMVQAVAETMGITETELLARNLNGSPVSLLHDDLIGATTSDLAAWGALLQHGEDLMSTYYKVDPVTGAVSTVKRSKVENEAEWLAAANNPPQDIIDSGLVGNRNIERVQFGGDGRELFIPGGEAALRDIETPWTAWEAHVIRSQIIDPGDLKDPALKHALDEKMWRGHTIDMADPANMHAIFNNYAFAMLSANMNLTRNEMISSRFRVNSVADMEDKLVAAHDRHAATITAAGYGPDHPNFVNHLGLAYSTDPQIAHYIPLDGRHEYVTDHMLPARTGPDGKAIRATQDIVEERAGVASGYLEGTTKAQRKRHREREKMVVGSKVNSKGKEVPVLGGGPIENWAIDSLATALNKGPFDEAIDAINPAFGLKRAAKYSPEQRDAIAQAGAALGENIDDEAARAVLAPYVSGAAKHDSGIIFKDWNVNGAGKPVGRMPDSGVIGHGDLETFAYLKNDDVSWRGTATSATMGRLLVMAKDMTENPGFYRRRVGEPLDQLGERISHRNGGLQLKTGFFGTDLGDPMNFNRGVHDIHMVGDLTEWMYDRTRKGTTKEWRDWYGALSKGKRDLIDNWRAKGAPHGAGDFKWMEAQGVDIGFEPGVAERAGLEAAKQAGDVASLANFVRRRIDDTVAGSNADFGPAQRERLAQMYRSDAELADLYGRKITTYGGDYERFEDTMTKRKALAEAEGGPAAEGLKRHGNGGYQWKLWDERRHIWDPETTAFATTHGMPRKSIRYMASSDDIHGLAGFFKTSGQPSTATHGYSYLDPINTILAQKGAGKTIRGATVTLDTGQKVLGMTKYRNRSTFLHEMVHVLESEMKAFDPSLERVVRDDLNNGINARNADIRVGGIRYDTTRRAIDDAVTVVNDAGTVLADSQARHLATREEATKAASHLQSLETQTANLVKQVRDQEIRVKGAERIATAERKAAQAIQQPSVRARALERADHIVPDAEGELAHLIATRDTALGGLIPAREAEAAARSAVDEAKIVLDEATRAFRDAKGVHASAEKAFNDVAGQALERTVSGWGRETSEHFADEFTKWLATGKATNPKMRDAFAYFRNVLVRLFRWSKDQPGHQVSPEMEALFQNLTAGKTHAATLAANAVPFDATGEVMHAGAAWAVTEAEQAAFENVQFRRNRSWLERSVNHPYFGIYPASYMWGKVAPEIIRGLAVHPFGLPVPFLSKPVKIGAREYGLHGTPYWGFVNAQRVRNAVELQKDTDPDFAAQTNDPKNQKVWTSLNMFLPATPWDIPANFPLWSRRIAEWGLESRQREAEGQQPTNFNVPKMASDVASYAFGPKATFDWLDQTIRTGWQTGTDVTGSTPTENDLTLPPPVTMEQGLSGAATQLQQTLGGR